MNGTFQKIQPKKVKINNPKRKKLHKKPKINEINSKNTFLFDKIWSLRLKIIIIYL